MGGENREIGGGSGEERGGSEQIIEGIGEDGNRWEVFIGIEQGIVDQDQRDGVIDRLDIGGENEERERVWQDGERVAIIVTQRVEG